jgi:hypothetical protein
MPESHSFFLYAPVVSRRRYAVVLVSTAFGFADFSGKWVLDLRASGSPHAIRSH